MAKFKTQRYSFVFRRFLELPMHFIARDNDFVMTPFLGVWSLKPAFLKKHFDIHSSLDICPGVDV
jgi:hypothetical protein